MCNQIKHAMNKKETIYTYSLHFCILNILYLKNGPHKEFSVES